MKINLFYILSFITFILFFLPAFSIPLAVGAFCFTYFFVFMVITMIILLCFNFNLIYKNIKLILKYKASKFFLLYFGFTLITTFLYILTGKSSISSLLGIFMRFLLLTLPFFISFMFINRIKNKKAFKLIYIILMFIILFGIFDFIAFYFDCDILRNFFNFFVNRRLIMRNLLELKAVSNGFPRIQSVFEEPCHIAYFITTMLPLIYKISFSKFSICNNKYLNRIIKISTPILAWLVLLGTQSPIYIIVAIIVSIIYFLILRNFKIKFNIGTFAIIFALLFITFLFLRFLLTSTLFENSILQRLQTFLKAFGDIDLLILAEQSLGRRLIDIINMLVIFLKNPIFGCGVGNLSKELTIQLLKSPVVLVPEVIEAYKSTILYLPTPNIFFSTLAETGIIGTLLLYSAFISVYKSIAKILPYTYGIEHCFVFGLKHFILLYIILSCYDSQLYFPYGLVIMGTSIAVVYNFQAELSKKKKDN